MSTHIRSHEQLVVYQRAYELAMELFRQSRHFPREEVYSLTDQGRRSSRSVTASITEGWRKRRYELSFLNKLNDAEGEAAETQNWLRYTVDCGYLPKTTGEKLHAGYDQVISMLVAMQRQPEKWILPPTSTRAAPKSPGAR